MKKIKTIKYSGLLFLSMLFLFGTTASASTNIADVCKTELKKNFQSFCQENENISSTLDIFKKERNPEKNGLQKISSPEGEPESQKSSGLTADGEERLITGIEEWTEDKTIDGEAIIVMPGAELKIKEGVTVQFRNSAIGVSGKLIAQGTAENPITFKSLDAVDNQGFIIFSGLDSEGTQGDEIIMSYVDISGGIKANYDNDYDDFGALTLGNAKLEIKESRIHGNGTAIMVVGDMPEEKTVNRTKFFDNRFDVSGYCFREGAIISPDFRYNWWGPYDESQWTHECYEGFGCFDFYSKVQGFVSIKPFFVSEDFHDPVIIVPGIMGSENKDGIWQIDPVFHTYDNLYEEFIGNGFVPDEDVFTFPYEWRNSNVENAKLLRDKINEIKQATGYPKVDIVAHSMGGLLAREYVESDYYQNDVEQLIALGTPQNGAPESYLSIEGGKVGINFSGYIFEKFFSHEAKENGFENIFKYIKERPILSVKELLPDYGYLYEVENNNELRSYPSNYPVNDFLENLNSFENVEKLENILFYKIIGNVKMMKAQLEDLM
jgi:pimeloyl-ACP methyl ester carboxylesterase